MCWLVIRQLDILLIAELEMVILIDHFEESQDFVENDLNFELEESKNSHNDKP